KCWIALPLSKNGSSGNWTSCSQNMNDGSAFQPVNGESFKFTDKVALITGGSTGIGRTTALLFARHEATVVIGDLNSDGAEVADQIKRQGGDALFVRMDVRDASQVEDLVSRAVKTFGGLDFAFNNAGILPVGAPLADVDEAGFDLTMAVDLKGIFLAMK